MGPSSNHSGKSGSNSGLERRPHVSEWFGHRVFPKVSDSAVALHDQKSRRCPFLSEALNEDTHCTKQANSYGVCTISSWSNKERQDWLVCPYRLLDDSLLALFVRRLYDIPADAPLLIQHALKLSDPGKRQEILTAARTDDPRRVFIYFRRALQGESKFAGGEIGLPKTPSSPPMSFDITVVELMATGSDHVTLGKYGVIELQTADTHGSYIKTVEALEHSLELHPDDFHEQLRAQTLDWTGKKIEGPNIANVFKRTFYQITFKFQVTKRETSVGCLLGLPLPVWDSWHRFLGAPKMTEQPDGTWRMLDDHEAEPTDWIYVFDIDEEPDPDGGPAAFRTRKIIGTDAPTLSRAAFEVAPLKAVEFSAQIDTVVKKVADRLGPLIPGVRVDHYKSEPTLFDDLPAP